MIVHVLVKYKEGINNPVTEIFRNQLKETGISNVTLDTSAKYFVINIGSYHSGILKKQVYEICRKVLANQVYEQFSVYSVELQEEDKKIILDDINEFIAGTGLKAEYLPGAMSVGVQGDARTFTPVVVLVGDFPGWDTLAEISNRISNETPINRVTYEFARRSQ